MKKLMLFAILITSFNCYAQITFEKGYFITNSGERIECLIKNLDWRNNPTSFKYKKNTSSIEISNDIKTVKEFGIYNASKYIRNNVEIDRSSNNLNNLSSVRNPVFKKETLFLQVVMEGKANLFSYADGNLNRYFYSIDKNPVQQLIYKLFNTNNKVKKNNLYKQQLLNNLKCSNSIGKSVEKLKYTKKSLIKYFEFYNTCNHSKKVNYLNNAKKNKNSLYFTLKIGNNFSSLNVKGSSPIRNVEFDNSNISFGIEGEYTLPFNKNKWALTLEPTYQQFSADKNTKYTTLNNKKLTLTHKLNYKSIEIPIGIKYNFFLNAKSVFFIKGSLVFDLFLNTYIKSHVINGSILKDINVNSSSNIAFSLGYKYKNYVIEIRHQSKELLGNNNLSANYKSFNLMLGYVIF